MNILKIIAALLLSGIGYIPFMAAQTLQNMATNASFEAHDQLPADLGELDGFVQDWSSPTATTPDFFHKNASGKNAQAPNNRLGYATPHTGNGYAGFYAYTERYNKLNFREYLQIELKQPMQVGEKYCIKAHVFLAQSSTRALKSIGVAPVFQKVNKKSVRSEHSNDKVPYEQHLVLEPMALEKADLSFIDDRAWVEVQATYTAIGGERFLILGNFDDDVRTANEIVTAEEGFKNEHVDFAYYFVDDLCVTSLEYNFNCDCGSFEYLSSAQRERIIVDVQMDRKTLDLGRPVILHKISFEKNSAMPGEATEKELEDLAAILQLNPTYEIEISGHTSNKGNPRDNQFLSKRRAQVVYDYLIASGIHESRVAFLGRGESRPVALNNSAEGRKQNERIEIKLVSE